jgi:serine/threonine-protein kinase HipA
VPTIVLARVYLWDLLVGAVSEDGDGTVTFEYADDFRDVGLEISPLRLPRSVRGPVQFPELRRSEAFSGLPGVLADALPDRFGNAVIRRYFADRGEPDRALSPVQRLLYVGSRAMGALEFRPEIPLPSRRGEREPLEIAELVRQARSIIQGRSEVAVPEIMQVGASAGGMRPKALVLWNPATDEVRSAYAPVREGDQHWMIKFDGVPPVGSDQTAAVGQGDPQPFMRIEYAYSVLARRAGLDVPATRLLTDRGYGHFMVRRFDRVAGGRLHQHTLGGLLHVDYNLPGAASYEDYLRTVVELDLARAQLQEAFRRVVFNVAGVNQDDHVKNLSFLMDGTGTWYLSPAYDLVFSRGQGWTRFHQMTVRGKREGITRKDLEKLGSAFGIGRAAGTIIDQVGEALGGWEEVAAEAGVPDQWVREIGSALRERGFAHPHGTPLTPSRPASPAPPLAD